MELYWKGFLIACKGIPTTVWVSLVALTIGSLLGLLLALGSQGKNRILKGIIKVYIDVVRGTPMIVQALVFAYGIPQFLQANGIMFKWAYLVIPAVLCCGLNSAAYMAEVVRSGIQAVDKGQMEAARSLGMSKKMAMRLVIIPQAVKIILPAFCNEFVTLIKETAVLSYVGVIEILRRGALWNAQSFETFPAYIGVALAYMLLTIPLTKIIGRYEKKLKAQEA
ncbi:MAG: amino acid ABC transporter permease [Clostridiales bacterium]|nr:amino acid ABC transporter permease [Candidatus Crickella caballi]